MNREQQDITSAILIPALQSAITALLVSLLAGALALYFKAEQPLLLALLVFGIVALLSWLAFRSEWRSRLEALLDIDINRDGVIGAPPVSNELRVSVINEDGRAGEFLSLPGVDKERLAALARGIVAGRGLAIHAWTGDKRPFKRPEFEELRFKLIEGGFLRWRSNNSRTPGIEPTGKGMALFRALAEQQPIHPPTSASAWHNGQKTR